MEYPRGARFTPPKLASVAKLVAQQCWNGLSEEDRALVREHLAAELIKLQSKGGMNKIVPDTQLREHGRRLAVLEEALAVFSNKPNV
jgi:hypothetical protein